MSAGMIHQASVRRALSCRPFAAAAAMLLLSACAGPIAVRSGASGPAVPTVVKLTMADSGEPTGPEMAGARKAVEAALRDRGYLLSDENGRRMELGLSTRPASAAIGVIGGQTVSPAKSNRLLQNCKDRTYRLTLTYYGEGDQPVITRSWAEESHCRGTLEDSLASLARHAVAALAEGTASRTDLRRGRD